MRTIQKVKKKTIEKKENIISSSFSQKYHSTRYFNFLLNKNNDLCKEINRIYDENSENISYKEDLLETDLILTKFIIEDFSEYNFVVRNGKIIFKNVISINRAKHYFEYKDWDNDNKKDLIEYYEQCEAGCLSFYKSMNIYSIRKDTILLKKQLPIKERICYDGFAQITDYQYKIKNKQLHIKKMYGRRKDCNSDRIQKIDSIVEKIEILQIDEQ